MFAQHTPLQIQNRPGPDRLRPLPGQEGTIVAIGQKTGVLTLGPVRYGQAQLGRYGPHLFLAVVSKWEQHTRQLFLPQPIEHIRLVLPPVDAPQELVLTVLSANARIVARSQVIGTSLAGDTQQRSELDLAVADQTGVGRAPKGIAIAEVLHDRGSEFRFQIHYMQGDAQPGTGPPRILHGKIIAAILRRLARGRRDPQAHRHTADPVALLHQKGGRCRTVDPTAESDNHMLHRGTPSRSVPAPRRVAGAGACHTRSPMDAPGYTGDMARSLRTIEGSTDKT